MSLAILGLISGILKLADTGATAWLHKLIDAHLNEIARLKKAIAEANRQFQENTDYRDDVGIIKLHDDLRIESEAFENQLRVGPPK